VTERRRPARLVLTIAAKETREILRDFRAVFFAFVLPIVISPFIFWGMTSLAESHRSDVTTSISRVGASVELVPTLASGLESDSMVEFIAGNFDEADVKEGRIDILVERRSTVSGDGGPPASAETIAFEISHLPTKTRSQEALRRLRRVVETIETRESEARLRRLGLDIDLVRYHEIVGADVASAEERGVARLATFLPALLVLLLLTGASFAALDVVAGEKERGTLETLAVQSVTRNEIVAGKFIVVLAVAIVAVVLDLIALWVASKLGLGGSGEKSISMESIAPSRLVVIAVVILPVAALVSALLIGISAHARTYREAQTLLLPVTLAALVPVGVALAPQVRLEGIVPWIPVTGATVAIREAIGGYLEWSSFGLVFVSSLAWAGLGIAWAGRVLGDEAVLLGLEPPSLASDVSDTARERRAILAGIAMLVLVWYAGTWLQSGAVVPFDIGLALTLWGVVAVPAAIYPFIARRPWREALGLVPARWSSVLVAVPTAMAAALVSSAYVELQELFLPFPAELRETFARIQSSVADLGFVAAFCLFALSPGIAEELFWRGAFLGDLAASGRRRRVIIWSAFFFGAFHLSVYRFVPTAFAGAVLAVVRLRSASILPCMVFHVSYNAFAAFVLPNLLPAGGLLVRPLVVVLAVFGLAAGLRSLSPRTEGVPAV
jgi:sodium transport system permease protein